jgi:outer membrane protein assembly factor BamB
MYVAFTQNGVMGLQAGNGELLWRYDKVSNRTANVATPLVSGNHVFVSSDYGTGCALLKLEPAGASGVAATEVYFSREMKNHHASAILVNDHLYGFNSSILTAMKWADGEVAWRDRSTGKGHAVFAGGHLVILGENGVVALVKLSPEAYKEVSRFSIELTGRPAWAPPVIANSNLLIRDQNSLYCYRLKP